MKPMTIYGGPMVPRDDGLDGVMTLAPADGRSYLTIGGMHLHVYIVRVMDVGTCAHGWDECIECERDGTFNGGLIQVGDGEDAKIVAEKLFAMTEGRVETFEVEGQRGRWTIYAEPHGE